MPPDTVKVNPGVAVVASPLDNDVDPDGTNDTLALQSVPTTITFPNGATGTLSIVGTRQISIDAAGARGSASFTYTLRDADGGVSGPVTVTVDGPPLNSPPDVADQSVSAVATVPVAVALSASDVNGDPLTIATLGDPRRRHQPGGPRPDDHGSHGGNLRGHVHRQRRHRAVAGGDHHGHGGRPAGADDHRGRGPVELGPRGLTAGSNRYG